MLPCSHCLRGKPRHRLNFVNTARRRSGSGSQHGCETEHPHAGRESWRRVRVGSAQPSPLPASPSPLNKHPCTKQKARRIPPLSPQKGSGARWVPRGAGIGRAANTARSRRRVRRRHLVKKQRKYLLNSSINIQINTFGPVSRGGRSHLATAGLSPDLFPVSNRAENQVYPTQPSHRCLTVWCPRSSVSHCTLILGRSLL